MNILSKIAAVKREEVKILKESRPAVSLGRSPLFNIERPSFRAALSAGGPSVIAEFKRRSPSRGDINTKASASAITASYQAAGAAAVSVLTDEQFFGGNLDDLAGVAEILNIPVLRKDFIVDEYQVIEARSAGASAILLIAAILTKREIDSFSSLAENLGMDVLFEIHSADELEKLSPRISIIGVNNRDLGTFEVSTGNSAKLLSELPAGCLKVAESGFTSPQEVISMHRAGYDAFLIGERFMRHEEPGTVASQFIKELNNQKI